MSSKVLPQSPTPLVRVSFFFTRKPGWTETQFHEYWRHKHGALTVASKAFHDANIQQYAQIRQDPILTKNAKELGLSLVESDWDGCSEIYFRNWDDYHGFATSNEMRDVLAPDGASMMDTDKGIKVLVSTVDPVFLKSSL